MIEILKYNDDNQILCPRLPAKILETECLSCPYYRIHYKLNKMDAGIICAFNEHLHEKLKDDNYG